MKTLAPVFFVLILLLALVSAVSAQSRIHNPELPVNLVFQWRVPIDQVHESWKNEDFFITRGDEGMVVYYGMYQSLEEAMANAPSLPQSAGDVKMTLVPFFNQRSISVGDALALLGDRTYRDVHLLTDDGPAVSFTVYFETFEAPQGRALLEHIGEALSFEVMPNYNYAYSAGAFKQLDEASEYAEVLRSKGYMLAEVNKYLNGKKVAMLEEQRLMAFVDWSN